MSYNPFLNNEIFRDNKHYVIFFIFQTKYTLLDERDISLVHEYTFEARTEIDKNGCGATVYAYAYVYDKGRQSGQYVQDLLW